MTATDANKEDKDISDISDSHGRNHVIIKTQTEIFRCDHKDPIEG
jgi:hypothetical protein